MTDPRPRPQYGEYATPEEQARALGIPPHAVHASKQSVPAHESPQATVPAVDAGKDRAQQLRRSRDALFTITLLALGLAWVLLSIPSASDFVGTLNRTYALQGYTGKYGPVALGSTIGLVINISSIALWGITCAVSIAVLRRHRRAFYIPVIGAAVTGIVAIALTLVAMLSDPGLIAYVNSLAR